MRNNKGYYDWRTKRFIPNKPSRSAISAYLNMLEEIGKIKVGKSAEPKMEKDGQLCLF